MRQRRSEQRFLCADLVKVEVRARDKQPTELLANLEDISPSGACLQLDEAVGRGADIEIVCARCRLKGRVRYCRYTEIGYSVGVQFEKSAAWDRQQFEPKHLLDIPVFTQTAG